MEITPFELDPIKWYSETNQDGSLEDLPEEWIEKASEEVHEKLEWRERDIEALRQMILGDDTLKVPVNDAFLLRFLRAQKFDYDRAFHMLKRYYLMHKTYPHYFKMASPSKTDSFFKNNITTLLNHRDIKGRRVYLHSLGKWDPAINSLAQVFASIYLCLELLAMETKTQVSGLVVVIDMSGFSLSQMFSVSTEYVKSIATIIQNTFPLRFREIHIINESYVFDLIFTLIKPFLSDIIRSRIQCHGNNYKRLHEIIRPEFLPEEFGGQCGPMSSNELSEVLFSYETTFAEIFNYGYINNGENLVTLNPHPFENYCLGTDDANIS